MIAEAVVYALLTGAGPVTSVVGQRIYPVALPMGTPMPAIVYSLVSAVSLPALDAQAATHLTQSRVQVDMVGHDFAALRALRTAVLAALRFQRGAIAGTTVHAVLHGGDGPPTYDMALDLHHRPVDLLITHEQP